MPLLLRVGVIRRPSGRKIKKKKKEDSSREMALRTVSCGGSAWSPAAAQHRTGEGRGRWDPIRARGARREGADAGRRWSARARQQAIVPCSRLSPAATTEDFFFVRTEKIFRRKPLARCSAPPPLRLLSLCVCCVEGAGPFAAASFLAIANGPHKLVWPYLGEEHCANARRMFYSLGPSGLHFEKSPFCLLNFGASPLFLSEL